jgi:hypothetical protein
LLIVSVYGATAMPDSTIDCRASDILSRELPFLWCQQSCVARFHTVDRAADLVADTSRRLSSSSLSRRRGVAGPRRTTPRPVLPWRALAPRRASCRPRRLDRRPITGAAELAGAHYAVIRQLAKVLALVPDPGRPRSPELEPGQPRSGRSSSADRAPTGPHRMHDPP